MHPKKIATYSKIKLLSPIYAMVSNVDLVVIKYENGISVLYGRCLHRGALLSDGYIENDNLICGLHDWDYNYETGVSAYNNTEQLKKFNAWVEEDGVWVDEDEIKKWEKENPQPYQRDKYLGQYEDIKGTIDEPKNKEIRMLSRTVWSKGSHGVLKSMGVSQTILPKWDDIQFQTAQLATRPLDQDDTIETQLIVGPKAKKTLKLDIPIIVSDMSYGALSEEAKVALAKGAEKAGTGICSGEGGMLPAEQEHNSKYFYELASAMFGYRIELLKNVQSFHFKAGQAAKTGIGGHLPSHKVTKEIAKVRGLPVGKSAISPPTFRDMKTTKDFRYFADHVREYTGGIPIGFKISANHVEDTIQFALDVGVDYIILDGRGGGTGAAPAILRDHISIPTIPALARARKYLTKCHLGDEEITLFITGGLRTAPDFAKALALGANGIAISNSAIQAIGCLGMRACATDNCPVGIATQKKSLRERFIIDNSATMLYNFLYNSVELMKIISGACGKSSLSQLNMNDIVTYHRDMHELSGIFYAGILN